MRILFIIISLAICLFLVEGCSIHPWGDDIKPETNFTTINTNFLPFPYSLSSVDADGDGISAFYDCNDINPKFPEPYLSLKENSSDIYSKAFGESIGTLNQSLVSDYTVYVMRPYSYYFQGLALLDSEFKLINNLLYYRYPDSSWNYAITNKTLSSISEIAKSMPGYSYILSNRSHNVTSILNNTSLNEIGGKLILLFDTFVTNQNNSQNIAAIFDTIGTAITCGVQSADFNIMINNLKNTLSYANIIELLSAIRDWFPYGIYLEIYSRDNNYTGSEYAKVEYKANNKTNGRPSDCFFVGDTVTPVVTGVTSLFKWEYYILGIARNIPDWDMLNFDSYYKIEVVSNNSLVIPVDYASDETFKRWVFAHGYCEKTGTSQRVDILTLLPVYSRGLNLTATVPNNGIIRLSNNILINDIDRDNKNLRQYLIKAKVYNNSSVVYVGADYDDYLNIPLNYLGSNSVVVESMPMNIGKFLSRVAFFSIWPEITIANLSSVTNQLIIGDPIKISLYCRGADSMATNANGAFAFGASNFIFTSSNTNYAVSNSTYLSNIIIDKTRFIINAGMQQFVDNNTVFVDTNMIIDAYSPMFVINGFSNFTNGETAVLSYDLAGTDNWLSNKFIGSSVIWCLLKDGTNINDDSTVYGSGETFTHTFSGNGNYVLNVNLNYNGVPYAVTRSFRLSSGQPEFVNITNGDYIYPALGGRKVTIKYKPNTQFIVNASLGGFSLTPDGVPQQYITNTADASGYTNIYYIGSGVPGGNSVTFTSGDTVVGNLKVMYNNNISLDNLLNDSNAILTWETNGAYHNSETVRFVQEMLNQVCPRKVTTAFGLDGIPRYEIISEDSNFGGQTTNAIYYLKNWFVRATNTFCPSVNAFSNDMVLFTRLSNEYPLLTRPEMIVDRKLLVGMSINIGNMGSDTNATGRDGLLEIYTNIVVSFIEQMIAEGERYVNYNSKTWYGRNSAPGILAQLQDDDGQVHTNISDELVTQGVAYGWGCIDNLDDFDSKLLDGISDWHEYTFHPTGLHSMEEMYWVQTNRSPSNWAVPNTNWPGTRFYDGINHGIIVLNYDWRRLDPTIWSGIDCRGFVQRTSKISTYSIGETVIPNIIVPDLENGLNWDIGSGAWTTQRDNVSVSATTYGNCYYFDNYSLTNLHKGDIVEVSGEHIAIIYENPNYNNDRDFRVINAYGSFTHVGVGFVRKTIIMPFNWWRSSIVSRNDPIFRYGRFTLWRR